MRFVGNRHSVAGPFRSGNWPNGQLAALMRSAMLASDITTGALNRHSDATGYRAKRSHISRRRMGRAVRDDQHLFELLVLEGAQAGLSWSTILNKRAGYRRAFADFDIDKVARFTPAQVEEARRGRKHCAPSRQDRIRHHECARRAARFRRSMGRSPTSSGRSSITRRSRTNGHRTSSAGIDGSVGCAQQGAETLWLQVRRLDDLLRVHAGGRHGQRSRGNLHVPRRCAALGKKGRVVRPVELGQFNGDRCRAGAGGQRLSAHASPATVPLQIITRPSASADPVKKPCCAYRRCRPLYGYERSQAAVTAGFAAATCRRKAPVGSAASAKAELRRFAMLVGVSPANASGILESAALSTSNDRVASRNHP